MANDISELKKKIEDNLNDNSKAWTPWFQFLEEVTGINRVYIFWVLIAFISLWLAFGYAGQLICNFIGIIYPVYSSIHALESRRADDDTKWLTYWVVFSVFLLIEQFIDIIIGCISFYWLMKSAFFVWLMMPGNNVNGSLIIYRHIIKPYFLQYHQIVDDAVNTVTEKASEIMDSKTK